MASNIGFARQAIHSSLNGLSTLGGRTYSLGPLPPIFYQDPNLQWYSGRNWTYNHASEYYYMASGVMEAWYKFIMRNAATWEEFNKYFNEAQNYYAQLQQIAGQRSLDQKMTLWKSNREKLIEQGKKIRAAQVEAAQTALNIENAKKAADVSAKALMDWYDVRNANLQTIIQTTDVYGKLDSAQALDELEKNEKTEYKQTVPLIEKFSGLQSQVQAKRTVFQRLLEEARPIVKAKNIAEVQKQKQIAIDKGQDPSKINYGTVTHTSKEQTGYWSDEEKQRIKYTAAQVENAVRTMRQYLDQLDKAIDTSDKKLKAQLRDNTVKYSKVYINSVSRGVKDHALWNALINEYNDKLSIIAGQLGESGFPWGIILTVGAVAGGAILLT
jgi:hypothetical protein